jgi:putative transposase
MVGSMGRVGAAGDNAAIRRTWDTREQLRIAIVTWIERTYHRRRRQPRLGRLTPIEFQATMNTPAGKLPPIFGRVKKGRRPRWT